MRVRHSRWVLGSEGAFVIVVAVGFGYVSFLPVPVAQTFSFQLAYTTKVDVKVEYKAFITDGPLKEDVPVVMKCLPFERSSLLLKLRVIRNQILQRGRVEKHGDGKGTST